MKRKRQAKILEIIKNEDVTTQEALRDKLIENGIEVTQATVSRDVNELNLVKVIGINGIYKYAASSVKSVKNPIIELDRLFIEGVSFVDYAQNIIVIKCHTGMAMAVCAKIDNLHFDNAVGTLAGDDTIFIVMRTEQDAKTLVKDFGEMLLK